jgi:hypothetical protein
MKITKVIQREIGIQYAGGLEPMHKGWIVSAIGAGLGLASSLFGASKSAEAAEEAYKAQMEANKRAKNSEEAWYQRKMNESYVDTAAGQALVNRAKEYAREQSKRASAEQAVTGRSDAATAMAKDAGNKMVGETISNMAAQDTARKDAADNQHRQTEQNLIQQEGNIKANYNNARAQATAQAAQGASNAIMSAATALDGKINLGGGSNGGVPAGNASDPTAAAAAMARGIKW